MTQKKNIASKLVLVLFVLTLLSCCLLGSTFARYVSGGTGSASVGIAKWDVTRVFRFNEHYRGQNFSVSR